MGIKYALSKAIGCRSGTRSGPGSAPLKHVQPGIRRQSERGTSLRIPNTYRSTEGTQTTSAPVSRPRTTASATSGASLAKGVALRPAVILVLTKPGLTTITLTPLPTSASPRPSAKPSSPALAAP